MLDILGKRNIIIISTVITLIMFTVVMFVVNPSIDGKNGIEVILLQVAFNKEVGIKIINSWKQSGIENFNQLYLRIIFTLWSIQFFLLQYFQCYFQKVQA